MISDFRAKVLIGTALLLASLLVPCVLYLDVPVAVLVKTHLYSNSRWSALTSNLPDLLLLVVMLVTFAGFSLYLVRSKKGICDTLTLFAKLVTWVAPFSYLVKSALKFCFGRITTRYWLENGNLYGFHWFNGGEGFEGFPSGHMLVMVSLLAALARFYPRTRSYCVALMVLLGTALIATNYHFVSDVIAGAYVGLLIEAGLFYMLLHEPRRIGLPAID